MIGYGGQTPDPKWPGGARIAVQFVLNYEEGAEASILHGDPASDMPAILLAAGGSVVVRGPGGEREITAADLFEDFLTTTISEDEIVKLSLSRVLPQEVLMYIYNNRQLTKNYSIKVNLVNNPKVPVAVSMRFLSLLRVSELKTLAKNKNVPNALATAARNLVEKKNSGSS